MSPDAAAAVRAWTYTWARERDIFNIMQTKSKERLSAFKCICTCFRLFCVLNYLHIVSLPFLNLMPLSGN